MGRNVYGLPSETQDSYTAESRLLREGTIFPGGEGYVCAIEISDEDRILYRGEFSHTTRQAAEVDLRTRLRDLEGCTLEDVYQLLVASDDYRGAFDKREHRTARREYEMVDVDYLWQFREYDRNTQPSRTPAEWAELKESMQNEGVREPLVVTYFQRSRRALLTEGNHRLAIARTLGVRALPVRVVRYNMDYGNRGVPVPGIEPRNGYVPADLLPSDIGMQTVAAPATASEESGEFDTHEEASIGDVNPKLHFMGRRTAAADAFEHYSFNPNLSAVDPSYYGSGVSGAERKRQRNDPATWVNRAYFYTAGSRPEEQLAGAHRYVMQLPPNARIYDMATDPDGLREQARLGGGSVDLNLFERKIKDAGYFGFMNSASQMPNVIAVFYPVPVQKAFEQPYRAELDLTATFVKQAGSTENYLQSLGVQPDVIQFIMAQPTDIAKRLVNETRKNPAITVQMLEDFVAKFSGQPKYEPTYREKQIASRFNEAQGMPDWILLMLKKHRVKPMTPWKDYNMEGTRQEWLYTFPELGETQPTSVGTSLQWFNREMGQIMDWARNTQAQLASFDLAGAKAASDKWHEEQAAAKGVLGGYEESNVVYTFKNGWTMQLVRTGNDLKTEGNLMGHCVGGYCREVTSGSSIIYSLRDPQNQPHVTIEIKGDVEHEPDENETYPYYTPGPPVMHGPTKEEWEIVQIQGKGNREPIPEYKAMIKEWLSTLSGKVSRGDDTKQNLDDAVYNTDHDLDQVEKLLDRYVASGSQQVDEYGIPFEFYVTDPTDFATRVMDIYEKTLGRRGWYRGFGDLARSLADAVFKADNDYFSQKGVNWPNRSILDVNTPEESAMTEENLRKYIKHKRRYSAVQMMYDRSDKYFDDWQMNNSENLYHSWVSENPEPDQDDYESEKEYERAYSKWEDAWHKEEEELLDDLYREDPLGGFYLEFFERLQEDIAKNKMKYDPFSMWEAKQLKYVKK